MDLFSDSSDSSQTDNSFQASDPESAPLSRSTLGKGLKALKQKDYDTAITSLEAVCQSTLDEGVRLKAQMGLVVAYARKGERRLAVALCKPLCQHPSRQVRVWAEQTMKQFERRDRPDQADSPPPLPSNSAISPSAGGDQTGFMPFDATDNGTQTPNIQRPIASGRETLSTSAFANSTQIQDQTAMADDANALTAFPPTVLTDSALQTPATDSGSPIAPKPHQAGWRDAGRAQKWNAIAEAKRVEFWLIQGITALVLILFVRALCQLAIATRNAIFAGLSLSYLPYNFEPGWVVVPLLALLFVLSPWLLTWILKTFYGLQPLSGDVLARRSPEAYRLIKRSYGQRSLPAFGILPTAAPVIMTYGFLPSNAHVVVSNGLLDQLKEDEIAALCAGESAHILNYSVGVMSLVTLTAQIPYLLYWQLATWGDRYAPPVLKSPIALLASLSYGLYWLLRLPGLWLSRARQRQSDRESVNLTGNPNGLTRALLKTAIGIAKDVQRQQSTAFLLEGFDLLMPVGIRSALTIGSVYPHTPLEPVLAWECRNPDRRWLTFNSSHPLLGDRLELLTRCARHWHLSTELDLDRLPLTAQPQSRRALLLQIAPFLGIPCGLSLALLTWIVGMIAPLFGWETLGWLWGDRDMLISFMAIGLGIGILIRINTFFPSIKTHNAQVDVALPRLLSDPFLLPIDAQPVRLQGRLLGRRSSSNALEQDLVLQTATGLIKLHYLSPLGAPGNLLPQATYPHSYVNAPVTVTGWFRRGATPWIDVDIIQPQRGNFLRSGHPIWSTILASVSIVYGLFLILRGG